MSIEAPLGVIGWNVRCNADPSAQYTHLQRLEDRLRAGGAIQVLLCLSEVTTSLNSSLLPKASGQTLAELMQQEGYEMASRPTTYFRDGARSENLVIASRDPALAEPVKATSFQETVLQKAHWFKSDNWINRYRFHERRVGSLAVGDLEIHTTHASFHSPGRSERQAILARAGEVTKTNEKILIGDLNCAFKFFITEALARGWQKLVDPVRKATWWGWELDHAFTTPALSPRSELEIGKRGPSDHKPLLVLIDSPSN